MSDPFDLDYALAAADQAEERGAEDAAVALRALVAECRQGRRLARLVTVQLLAGHSHTHHTPGEDSPSTPALTVGQVVELLEAEMSPVIPIRDTGTFAGYILAALRVRAATPGPDAGT